MGMSLSKLQKISEGQGSLECCSPRGHKDLDTTYRLNKNKNGFNQNQQWLIVSGNAEPLTSPLIATREDGF